MIDDARESIYLRYLPAIYRQDPLLCHLLLIFESVLAPLERMVDTLPLYTEPEIAPRDFLPWLAHWVALSLDSAWPPDRQRALVVAAVEIYRWRGTRRGLKLHIKAYTGVEPLIQEYQDGFVLGGETRLGLTTRLATEPCNPVLFVVTVPVAEPQGIDPAVVRAIVDEDKPAHATYRLHIVDATATYRDDDAVHNGHRAHGGVLVHER